MDILDQILKKEQELNGVKVFKEGDDLKNGLIDIDKIFSVVESKDI